MTKPTDGIDEGPDEPRFKSVKLDIETYRRSSFARDSLMELGLDRMPERMRKRVRESLIDHAEVPRHKGTIGMTVAIALAMDLLFDALELTWPMSSAAVDDAKDGE